MRVRPPGSPLINWVPNSCKVDDTTVKKMKRSVTNAVPALPALDTNTLHNLAHVFPCGQIKHNVQVAVDNWGTQPIKDNLMNFAMWIFEIDAQAWIQEEFITGTPGVVTFASTVFL